MNRCVPFSLLCRGRASPGGGPTGGTAFRAPAPPMRLTRCILRAPWASPTTQVPMCIAACWGGCFVDQHHPH